MQTLEYYIQSYFGIEPKDLKHIVSLFKTEQINKGKFYLKENQICNQLSFIQSGMMRIYKTNEDKEITQWISMPGSFVTDLSGLIFRTPARWNIQTLSDCEIYTISYQDYQKIGTLVPEWHALEKLFIAKCFTILEDRIYSHLSQSAEERYIQLFEYNKAIFQEVPLQYIASMLGMTPETLSRIRKKHFL